MSGRPYRGTRERLAGIAGLALAVVVGAGALWLAGPPRPLATDAAADRFAAGRALADVEALARRPRPVGSEGHRAARDYLRGRMTELGLAPEVQETTVARRRGERRIRAARVRNLVGRLAGRGGTGAVLLVAHYDSRPNTPGAGDDASGVAVVLETVRALAHGEPLQRDLILLLSDAEELGLLGARAFAAEHPWMEEVELVLNFEARGSRGPAVLFETGEGDLPLVRAFARAAPRPLASSLSAEVYQRMPNDTDFSEFRARGRSGLNFAFVGGLNAYHSALDTPGRLDPASLQHAGGNAVALLRHLDGRQAPERGAEGIWFNPLGGWLLVAPAAAALPVAAVLALLALVAAALAVRRRQASWAGLRSAALLAAAVLLLAPLGAALFWKLFADNAGGLLDSPHGLPHRLPLTGLALLLVALACAAVLAGLARPRPAAETALGTALTWAVLALASAVLAPGASFLFSWPLWGLLAAAGVVVAVRPPRSVALLCLAAGAAPGVALLAPLALLVFQAMTPHLAAAALAPAALILALVLPLLVAVAAERQGLSLAALVGALALLAAAVWGGGDAARPRTADLRHLQDLDSQTAYWLSWDERPAPWVEERLGARAGRSPAPSYLAPGLRPILRAPAPLLEAAGPEAEVVRDLRQEGRRLTVLLRSPAGAPMLRVTAAANVEIVAVELAGERFEELGEDATRPLRLDLAGLPPEGLEVTFELTDSWPVELDLVEQFHGLPGGLALPPGLIPDGAWSSHSRLVHRSVLR